LIETAKKGEKLEAAAVQIICYKAKEIFAAEPNVVKLRSPITLVGDIHG
jgi:serine/threonine-protein phosphatase PPG1